MPNRNLLGIRIGMALIGSITIFLSACNRESTLNESVHTGHSPGRTERDTGKRQYFRADSLNRLSEIAISAASIRLNPDVEYNIYANSKGGDTMSFVFNPQAGDSLDSSLEVFVSIAEKRVVGIRHDPESRPSLPDTNSPQSVTDSARRAHIAEPFMIPEKPMRDVTKMTLLDVAIDQTRDKLQSGCPYNIEYYYGPRGMNNTPSALVEFHPTELGAFEVVKVLFEITKPGESANASANDGTTP